MGTEFLQTINITIINNHFRDCLKRTQTHKKQCERLKTCGIVGGLPIWDDISKYNFTLQIVHIWPEKFSDLFI